MKPWRYYVDDEPIVQKIEKTKWTFYLSNRRSFDDMMMTLASMVKEIMITALWHLKRQG
jgi:hypothetical protein